MKNIEAVLQYLGRYNFWQIIILIIIVPLVVTICLKILKPKKIGNAEFSSRLNRSVGSFERRWQNE